MKLNLKFDLLPENAPLFAQDIVKIAKDVSNIHLDYSVQSVKQIDDLIESFRSDGLVLQQVAETIFALGCYVGQVMVQQGGGKWVPPSDLPVDLGGAPFFIAFPDGSFSNPVGKAFKRMVNGDSDSLTHLYQTAINPQ
jgi:hypothetical protein